jgi:hypothetical protein
MRVAPTSLDINDMGLTDGSATVTGITYALDGAAYGTNMTSSVVGNKTASFTTYRPYWMRGGSASSYLGLSAEL